MIFLKVKDKDNEAENDAYVDNMENGGQGLYGTSEQHVTGIIDFEFLCHGSSKEGKWFLNALILVQER